MDEQYAAAEIVDLNAQLYVGLFYIPAKRAWSSTKPDRNKERVKMMLANQVLSHSITHPIVLRASVPNHGEDPN